MFVRPGATRASVELRALAQRVADALPAGVVEEVVLTGSVSRGAADGFSDIEMLVVTRERIGLDAAFAHAAVAGLDDLGTWGPQGTPASRVSGVREGVPIELIWQARADAEAAIDAIFEGDASSTADALAGGVSLRSAGHLARWQVRLGAYPDDLAARRIEQATLTWGGFAPAGVLTLTRPGDRLALLERLVDDAGRVLSIVYAVNRVWQPTSKRLAHRTADLARKPERLPERIDAALSGRDPRRALRTMTRLQQDAVALAPDGPNVLRARAWLAAVAVVLDDEGSAR